MKRQFLSSHSIPSRIGGWRVTYLDGNREPLLSLWGTEPLLLNRKAQRLLEATPEPIDATLQATMWHGKRAYA